MSSHPSPVRFILPTWVISAADTSASASPPSTPFGRILLIMNDPELGDSEGARRRMNTVRGVSVLARVKRCGTGFNTFEGMGWLIDGVKLVGGSCLRRW